MDLLTGFFYGLQTAKAQQATTDATRSFTRIVQNRRTMTREQQLEARLAEATDEALRWQLYAVDLEVKIEQMQAR